MKKTILCCAAVCAFVTLSCDKAESSSDQRKLRQGSEAVILFSSAMPQATKAMNEVTSVRNFMVSAVYSENSLLKSYFVNQKTKTSGTYEAVDSYYWPDWDLSFHAVYPAVKMTVSDDGITIPVGTSTSKLTGNEDYVCARAENVAKQTNPVNLVFEHILANIAGVRFSTSYAGQETNVKVDKLEISVPKYGTYSLIDRTWSGLGKKTATSLPHPETLSGTDTGSETVNLSFIPGEYVLSITYTVFYNGTSATFSKTAKISLPAGKKSTLVASFSGSEDLDGIQFSVEVTPWTEGEVPVVFNKAD